MHAQNKDTRRQIQTIDDVKELRKQMRDRITALEAIAKRMEASEEFSTQGALVDGVAMKNRGLKTLDAYIQHFKRALGMIN